MKVLNDGSKICSWRRVNTQGNLFIYLHLENEKKQAEIEYGVAG